MIYTLRHRTTYEYEGTIAFARCVLRLTPQSSASQTVSDSVIIVTPQASATIARTGPFGEHTVTLTIDKPHKTLVIEARSRVDVHTPPLPDATTGRRRPGRAIRALSYESEELGPESPATYLYPTPRTPVLPQITDYARASFAAGRPIVEPPASDPDDPDAIPTSPTTTRPPTSSHPGGQGSSRPSAGCARTLPTS